MKYELWACEENALLDHIEAAEKVSPMVQANARAPKAPEILSVSGDVATINIHGVLTPSGPSTLERIFGITGTAYSDITSAVELAASAKEIGTIVLDMNTPGGTVTGVDEAYYAILAASEEKRVVAVNRDMVASAGYWLASAADEIVAASQTARTGSIGVVITATDTSKFEDKMGVKRVNIVSKNAPNKRPDLASDEGLAEVQREVDAIERVFIQRVAHGRSVSEAKVKKDFGRGGMFIASDPDKSQPDALSAGMIDAVKKSPREVLTNGTATAGPETHSEESMDAVKLQELQDALAQVTAERDELQGRISAAAKYLGSDSYPNALKGLALKVLGGESSVEMLNGAVIAFDAMSEAKVADSAAEDSAEAPELTGAPKPEVGESEVINSYEEMMAEVKSHRTRLGLEE